MNIQLWAWVAILLLTFVPSYWIGRYLLAPRLAVWIMKPRECDEVVLLVLSPKGRVELVKTFAEVKDLNKFSHIAIRKNWYWLGLRCFSFLSSITPLNEVDFDGK